MDGFISEYMKRAKCIISLNSLQKRHLHTDICLNVDAACRGGTDLQPSIQRPLDGDALAGMDTVGGDGSDE